MGIKLRRAWAKDTKVCPVCKGNGVINNSDEYYEEVTCHYCKGHGYIVIEHDKSTGDKLRVIGVD